jgi:hypothetical protein
MTDKEARAAARNALGLRARAYRSGDTCFVARHEVLVGGTGYRKVYGSGPSWQDALSQAELSYQAMRANPNRGLRDEDE